MRQGIENELTQEEERWIKDEWTRYVSDKRSANYDRVRYALDVLDFDDNADIPRQASFISHNEADSVDAERLTRLSRIKRDEEILRQMVIDYEDLTDEQRRKHPLYDILKEDSDHD